MNLFSYILILTSVIFALGIAQLLEGVSRIMQSRSAICYFVPHTLWVLNLFLFIFLIWWATWEFREIEWSFPKYAYMLIAPTALFLACSLLSPQEVSDERVDLEEHFLRIRKLFFSSYLMPSQPLAAESGPRGRMVETFASHPKPILGFRSQNLFGA